MKKTLFILCIFFLSAIYFAHASHNRAGEITFAHIGNDISLQYQITITTYTKLSSILADRPSLDSVHLGDGTIASFPRVGYVDDQLNNIRHNTYIGTHTYPGTGQYDIYFIDPNRNGGVVNIPNSFYTPFAVHATLFISPNIIPRDNSPILLNPPIDRGCVGIPFIHNPNAYDPDGDSLSFELTVCRGDNNVPIPDYTLPYSPNSFSINPITGQLTWDYPTSGGAYNPPYEVNVAFEVKEWRKIGSSWTLIGIVERDMQISISTCSNHPPIIQPLRDTCVLAGDSIGIKVMATDPDGNFLMLSSTGGPYVVPQPAQFTSDPPYSNDTINGLFSWNTACSHVRRQPYQVQFKAQDTLADVDLVDLKSFFITVVGPPPNNLTVTPTGSNMQLAWSPDVCPQVVGYHIYHRNGSYPGTIQCPCETGAQSSITGYTLIGTTHNLNDTTFLDTNNGLGLAIGVQHCYLVTAIFPDGSESCASPQSCARLRKELPVITNASVNTTDLVNGSMYVAWSKATEIDTIAFPPPYSYKLYHSPDFFGANFSQIPATLNENDTTFIDTIINTDTREWSYRVELYYNNGGVPTLKGHTQTASSVFLKLTPSDKKITLSWEEHVPWTNVRFAIFRFNTLTTTYDSIANTTLHTYSDSGLVNGTEYCYYIKAVGSYGTPGILDTLINLSERKCAKAIDNVPPCPPELAVYPDCVEEHNTLVWTNPNHFCATDVFKYYIYYSPDSTGFEVIDTIYNLNDTTFIHSNISVLEGCYKVTAIDSVGNESAATMVCVDTCRQYVLPSVFTPNGDGDNDFFHPCDSTTNSELQKKNCPAYKNVKDIDIKIYNRWGNLVFETTDKDINWDGKNKFSKGDCPDGVYYYTCKVNFFRLHGSESKELHGYVHLIRGK